MNMIKDRHILFIIVLFVFGFLSLTRTLTSGYHFVDDHEIIRIKHDLGQATLGKVTATWVKQDINTTARFRPLYFVFRVIETKLFGSNFFMFSLFNGLLWSLTLILFYLGIRNLSFSIIESVIFLIITFIGPQMEIWWRLGPQESLGMTFLAFSFYFMSLSIAGKQYAINNILFVLLLIAASLTKESFILIIPAILLFKVWYERKYLWQSIGVTLIKNAILLIPLLIAAGEIFFIKKNVGLINSGLNDTTGILILNVLHITVNFLRTYISLFVSGILLIIISLVIKKKIHAPKLFSVLFFAMILIPNLFLYSGYGLVDRYLLPATVGLGYFVIVSIRGIKDWPPLYRKVAYLLVIASFLPFLIQAVNDAIRFSREGRETNRLLTTISNNIHDSLPALVIIDPVQSYEKSISLKYYLNNEFNIDLYGQYIEDPAVTEESKGYIEGWKSYFSGKLFEDIKTGPGLLIFLNITHVDKFFQTSGLDANNFSPVDLGVSSYILLKADKF